MKKLILTFVASIALSAPSLEAAPGDGTTSASGVLRSSANMYRPLPRAGHDANRSGRFRQTYYKPTQHFYSKDKIVSYRYTEDFSSRRGSTGNTFLGPRTSVYVPWDEAPAPASIRSYAVVHRRPQPGVGMTNQMEAAKPAPGGASISTQGRTRVAKR